MNSMPDPIITLTTDFGESSPYVASMKGVILGVNPQARLVDLSHRIPPQDVRFADYFLAAALPCFPSGVLHVVVVDPGVGTKRSVLYVELDGHRLLVPDNGCWTSLGKRSAKPVVRRVSEPRYWRQPVSNTFHGRDIFSPVAGHLSLGLVPKLLGPKVKKWVNLKPLWPLVNTGNSDWKGQVIFVDNFGNLITNLPASALDGSPTITIAGQVVSQRVRTYGEAEPGTLVALVSSTGNWEIAVVQGNAAERLGAKVGTPVLARYASAG
jgi:S-adenosylmethionine hydrolase